MHGLTPLFHDPPKGSPRGKMGSHLEKISGLLEKIFHGQFFSNHLLYFPQLHFLNFESFKVFGKDHKQLIENCQFNAGDKSINV